MEESKDVLTTGQVAKICNVAPRTVSKWFDTGQLRGYRIPGSKDRRIPRQQLIRFMKAYGMPLAGLETGKRRVLLIDGDADLAELVQQSLNATDEFDVQLAGSAFEAGAVAQEFHPHVIMADIDLHGIDGRTIRRFLRGQRDLQGTQLIALSGALTESDRQYLLQEGFDETLAKPFSIHDLTRVLE
jgi:excisionase family DNA binding protein